MPRALSHQRHRRPSAEKRSRKICLDVLTPIGKRSLQEGFIGKDARVVDQDVEPLGAFADGEKKVLYVPLPTDVGPQRLGPMALRLGKFRQFPKSLPATGHEERIGAFFHQLLGNRPPDAPAGARNKRDFSLKFSHAGPSCRAKVAASLSSTSVPVRETPHGSDGPCERPRAWPR